MKRREAYNDGESGAEECWWFSAVLRGAQRNCCQITSRSRPQMDQSRAWPL